MQSTCRNAGDCNTELMPAMPGMALVRRMLVLKGCCTVSCRNIIILCSAVHSSHYVSAVY